MTEKKQPSIDWRRIYALPYNHFFKDKVKQMRSYLELPENGISENQPAWAWLEKHLTEKRPQPWFLPKPVPSDEKLWETEVPIWKVAVYLIAKFGIPLRMRSNIGLYLVTNDEDFLTSWRGLDVNSAINVKAAEPQLSVTVDGINAGTTKEQWLQVWKDFVVPNKKLLGNIIKGRQPAPSDKTKRQVIRWAHLYQIVEIEKIKDPNKALEILGQRHSDEAERWRRQKGSKEQTMDAYDASGVYYAVKEFKKLITPISP